MCRRGVFLRGQQSRPHPEQAEHQRPHNFSRMLPEPIPFDVDRPIRYGDAWGACFNWVRHDFYPTGLGYSNPKFLAHPTCAHTVWHTATKFCMAIVVDDRKILHKFDRACSPGLIFVIKMLKRELSVITNLLVCFFSVLISCYPRNTTVMR